MSERPIAYWSCDKYEEVLKHVTLDDAVRAALDDGAKTDGILTAHGFARMQPHRPEEEDVIYNVLQRWEEFGNPEGDIEGVEGITAAMRVAAKDFLDVMMREYTPWMCEAVRTEQVDVAKWLAEHPEVQVESSKP